MSEVFNISEKTKKSTSDDPSKVAVVGISYPAPAPLTTTYVAATKFKEIAPYISCLVGPEDFEEALASHYSQIYIQAPDGYYKHMKLSGGRHVRVKVDKLPTPKEANGKPVPEIKESLNFLPAGKIPYEYFEQIVHFFREVMRLKKADYEAHAWILWEKDKGYYISIPKQTVSKAAVHFSYDEAGLPPGAVIVCDIHSHNTMSSFYSSTDNMSDSTGIYYSGVIGKLTKDSYEYVMRFNLNLHKIECDLPDIFEMKEEIVNIPSVWLDQVQIQAPTVKPLGLGMGKSFAANKEGFGYAERGAKGKWTAQGSLNSLGSGEQIESSYWDELYRSRSGTSAKLDDLYPGSNSHNLRPSTYYDPDTKTFKGNSKLDRTQSLAELVEAESELSDTAEAHLAALRASEGEIYEEDPVGGAEGEDGDDAERHPLYEAYKTEYGEDTAEAFEIIDSYLGDLEGCDEGLVDIIQQSFDMLSNKAQAKIQTDGLS